jgi:tetratricopeptide (TPR) repeat protein
MLSSTVKAWVLGLSIAFGGIALPQRVVASTHNSSSAITQRARRHFLVGKRAFEAKRYAAALKEFEAGYAIDPRPGFLLNMGHASRRMGDLRRARDYYLKFLESDPPASDRRTTIALVVEIDRQLAAAPTSATHASVAPEPAAVTPPPAVDVAAAPAPVEAAPATPVVAAFAEAHQAPAETESPRPRLHLEPAVAVRVTSPGEIARSEALVALPVAREETSPPIYRRWWFWAAAGAAAGLATAITVGALGSGSSARDSGTWGQIRL